MTRRTVFQDQFHIPSQSKLCAGVNSGRTAAHPQSEWIGPVRHAQYSCKLFSPAAVCRVQPTNVMAYSFERVKTKHRATVLSNVAPVEKISFHGNALSYCVPSWCSVDTAMDIR